MVVHPVEGFSVFACFHIYGILFPIHPLTFAVGAFSVTAVNMITHCGYRLPVYDWFFATSRASTTSTTRTASHATSP
jgi:sterol desaturase/sphingolipid hydroxylase (fatty acid hydroxylase superfamily)